MSQIFFHPILDRSYTQRNTNNIDTTFSLLTTVLPCFNLWAQKEREAAAPQLGSSTISTSVVLHCDSFSAFCTQDDASPVFLKNVFYHQKFIHTLEITLSHLLRYIPRSTPSSPPYSSASVSPIYLRSLPYLVGSWGNHILHVSVKVSNLLQLVRSFPCNRTSYGEKVLLTKLKYNPVGLRCCYVRHSNMWHYCYWDLSPPILLSSSYCICNSLWFITTCGFTNVFFLMHVKPYGALTGTFTIKLLLLCPCSFYYDNKASFDMSSVIIKICWTLNVLLISNYILPTHCIISCPGTGEKVAICLTNNI